MERIYTYSQTEQTQGNVRVYTQITCNKHEAAHKHMQIPMYIEKRRRKAEVTSYIQRGSYIGTYMLIYIHTYLFMRGENHELRRQQTGRFPS